MTQPAYAMNQPNFAELYERFLVQPLFRPWAELLLERVGVKPGDRVLDLACGTGVVARLAKERLGDGGRVVGLDKSPPMVAVARATAPGVEWLEGDATSLPFRGTEIFDVVVCQQGLQFFPDRPAAVREIRRVLAPGGRLGVSTWRPLDEVPCFQAIHRVAERRLGPIVDQRHGFGDGKALEALLIDAGFVEVRVETVSCPIHFDDGATFLRMNAMALVGMSAGAKAMSDDERVRVAGTIAAESPEVLSTFFDGKGLRFQISSNVATARG